MIMKDRVKEALYKLKKAWKSNEQEIILFIGVLLVGAIGFEIGFVQGQSIQSKPLIIEVPAKPEIPRISDEKSVQSNNEKTIGSGVSVKNQDASVVDQKCAFVGSKNSDKYHLLTCAVVKRIKPENKVCFSSEEDAKSKGYTAGCLK